jgi:hypothetical protein
MALREALTDFITNTDLINGVSLVQGFNRFPEPVFLNLFPEL